MADYKLRLDVDAKLLEKNLEAAVKKAFGKLPGMSGGGMGGGFSGMGGNYQKQAQRMQQKLQKAGTKLSLTEIKQREKYIHDMKMVYIKEKAALRAHNIMLEKSGARAHQTFRSLGRLMGGRAGGAVGTGMDIGFQKLAGARTARTNRKEAQTTWDAANASWGPGPMANISRGKRPESNKDMFNSIMDKTENFGKTNRVGKMMAGSYGKFKGKDKKSKSGKAMGAVGGVVSKVPQLVKLAGIGAALAGGAGLGKMIVDSSPMLKSMLKLLNVGVMLILRPIGDFIGFMLRPLLLEFVKKVAVPAYKSGSKLAKEWGDKAGKAMVMMFTDMPAFLQGAILDPIQASLEKTWVGIVKALKDLGTILNVFDDDESEFAKNEAWAEAQNSQIDKKYPGLGGGGMFSPLEKMVEVGESSKDTLNSVNEKMAVITPDADFIGPKLDILDQTVKEKIDTSNLILGNIENNLGKMIPLFDLQQADIASEIAQEFRDQCVATNSGYEFKTTMGSRAIEKEAKDKEIWAANERLKKAGLVANPDGSLSVDIKGLSPEAQKRLAEANRMKDPSQNGPQAGGREGTNVGFMATEDMGWDAGTGEYLCVDGIKEEVTEYRNYATETREGMEIYSKAIAESEKWGTKVHDEWKKIHSLASETESKASKIDTAFCSTLQSSEEVQSAGTDMADNFDTVATCVDTLAATMKNAVDNFSRHEKYLAKIMKQASYIKTETGATKYPGMAAGADAMAGASLSPGEVEAAKAMYKITFGDGTSRTQGLDPASYKHLSDMRARGELYRGKSILSITKMAKGGIIGEKIFGIGESGQQYMFGESGPETVTPGVGGTVNNGGGSTFNITINASNTGDIERQLKPAILRMLKESTARAGIV